MAKRKLCHAQSWQEQRTRCVKHPGGRAPVGEPGVRLRLESPGRCLGETEREQDSLGGQKGRGSHGEKGTRSAGALGAKVCRHGGCRARAPWRDGGTERGLCHCPVCLSFCLCLLFLALVPPGADPQHLPPPMHTIQEAL